MEQILKIGIATIAYNQPERLKLMVESAVMCAPHMSSLRFFIFSHSNIRAINKACIELTMSFKHVMLLGNGTNRGVARSWNDGILEMMKADCDVMIICNDDISFAEGDLKKIAHAALDHRDHYAVFCAGFHEGFQKHVTTHGMACFAIQPIAVERIGLFDENFFPAYNEDVDYDYRAKLAEIPYLTVGDTNVHHLGSAAIQASSELRRQNFVTHALNDQYWLRKWNCKKGERGWEHPFNDPQFDHFISTENRHAPYPGHNRTDQGIVKL